MLLAATQADAHNVVWLGNLEGDNPNKPLVVQYPYAGLIYVQPAPLELCIVEVSLAPPTSDLLEIAIGDNPALQVEIDVAPRRPPANNFESALISGSWAATGQPPNQGCDAQGTFDITVDVGSAPSAQQPNAAATGDPVATGTGELTARVSGLSLGGPLPLTFELAYGTQAAFAALPSALGANWMHSFDATLSETGTVGRTAIVAFYPGKTVEFSRVNAAWVLTSPERTSYQLVSVGAGYQFLDVQRGRTYTFNAAGVLTSIGDRNGNSLTVTQGLSGPLSVADGLGRTLSFTYSGSQLTRVADQSGRAMSFAYSNGVLSQITDAAGKSTTYSYAPGVLPALMTSATRPRGNVPWTQQFDVGGRVVTQTDSGGHPTTIAFGQPAAGSTTIVDPVGAHWVHAYDASGNLTTATDAAGHATGYTYDADWRMLQVVDRLGRATQFTHDPASGYVATITNALGQTTSYTYAPQQQGAFTYFNLTAITYPDATAATFGYDAKGNLVSSTDTIGNTATLTYNARGQLLTLTNPGGGVTSYSYNADGTIATITNPVGNITQYAYDDKKRVTQVTLPDSTSRSIAYDAMDRPVQMTDERGGVATLTYDANGNLTTAKDPSNATTAIAYDTDDLVQSVTDASAHATTYARDARGGTAAMTNAAGETTSYTYDALGRLVAIRDPSGKGPTMAYDADGNPAAVTDANGNTTTFTVDALGRLVAVTSPLGKTTTRSFDATGRAVAITDPLLRTSTLAYDNRGRLIGVGIPTGIAVAFARDNRGLVTGVTDPNGNVWTRSYDAATRLHSRTDPLSRATTFGYDSRDRIATITTPEGSTQFTRDAAGNITQRGYSDNASFTMTYDANDRPIAGTGVALGYDAPGRIVASNGLTIARDTVGRISGVTYAPGKTVAYSYDARGLLSGVSDWAGGAVAFVYRDDGRVVTMTRANGVTTTYTYDADGRVVSIAETAGATTLSSIVLERDALGRVATAVRNVPQDPVLVQANRAQTFDAGHQLVGAGYDGVGRLTQDAQRTYAWNQASQLTGYTGAGGSATFAYDAFDLRTTRTIGGAIQAYVLNYALDLPSVATIRQGGVDQRHYVWAPDGSLLYAIDASGNAHHYYHFDEVGSTVFLSSDAGAVTDAYGITPYGETVTATGSTENPFTWLGRWGVMQEPASGLYYMRERYYDALSSRFISPDPIVQAGPRSVNPYSYALGDPLGMIDPSGAKGITTQGAFNGIAGYTAPALPGAVAGTALWAANVLQAEGVAAAALSVDRYAERLLDYYEWSQTAAANEWVYQKLAWNHINRWWNSAGAASGQSYVDWRSVQMVENIAAREGPVVEQFAEKLATGGKWATGLRTFGNVLGGIGVAIKTGSALVEDLNNGLGSTPSGIIITYTDTLATGVAAGLTTYIPGAAVLNLATGGTLEGGIHAALVTPNTVAAVVLSDRMNTRQLDAVQAIYDRIPFSGYIKSAGNYWDNKLGLSDLLSHIVR